MQRLKQGLGSKAVKTVNNVLTVLNVLLKTAVEWQVISQMPCTIRLLPVPKSSSTTYHDFGDYGRLVKQAQAADARTYIAVLLGGEAGLRCGEMLALEWPDVDLPKRQLCVQRSDWNGHITAPKNGRLRYIPLTVRLATALRAHRHLRGPLVLCQEDGSPLTRQDGPELELVAWRGVPACRTSAYTSCATRFAPIWRCGVPSSGPFKNWPGHATSR